MNIKIYGTNLKITDGMSEALNSKLEFLDKFLDDTDKITVNVSSIKNVIKMSTIVVYNEKVVKIEETNEDFYVATDKTAARLKIQILKLHSLKIKRQNDHESAIKYVLSDNETSSIEPKIVKRKETTLEVITEKEALDIMDTYGYDSYVFKNADEDEKVCMLHSRNDGDYFIVICR